MTRSVVVIIPAYNRGDALRRTLGKMKAVAVEGVDILVIDDCSSTGAIVDVVAEFAPSVRYARTPQNLGVIGARNHAFGLVGHAYVLHLDDDSYLEEPGRLGDWLDLLDREPGIGVLAFNIRENGRLDWPAGAGNFLSRGYKGGGTIWRRSAIVAAGSLSPLFWRQGEELEHSARLYEAGYTILAVPAAVVVHEPSPIGRNDRRGMSLEAANYLKRIVLTTPPNRLPFALVRWLAFMLRHFSALSARQVFEELRSNTRGLRHCFAARRPVRSAIYDQLERLKTQEARL